MKEDKNIFVPFVGTLNIKFGEDREALRKKINCTFKNFLRNEFAQNTTDYYIKLGFFIEYNEQDRCHGIEFTKHSNLHFQGNDLFQNKYEELRDIFDSKSTYIEEEEGVGVTYRDLGFGISQEIEGEGIETIIIFTENYWDYFDSLLQDL